MKLLIILAQYHPALNPNVYRWAAIARHWTAQGHEVHILCTRRSGLLDETVMDGVHVHRAGQNSLLDWTYNLLRSERRRGEAGGDLVVRHGKWRTWVEKIVDYTWRSFYWPDGRCVWYGPARRCAKRLLQAQHFDGIISVGAPFTAHLIGLACKRAQQDLTWLVDIEDPFAFVREYFINNRRLYGRLNNWAEARVLRKADAITVTVETAQTAYAESFPESAAKITVIPPLFDGAALQPLERLEYFEPDRTHLAYLGAFYTPIRTPDAALELIHQLLSQHPEWREKLVVHFFGEVEYAAKVVFENYAHLAGNLRLHGLVDRTTVAAAMAQTDFLLNIGNTTTYNLPSKSADYLASGKPIIHLSASAPDTFLSFMADHPLLFTAKTEAVNTQTCAALSTFLAQHKGAQMNVEEIQNHIKPYQTAQIAEQYLSALLAAAQ